MIGFEGTARAIALPCESTNPQDSNLQDLEDYPSNIRWTWHVRILPKVNPAGKQ
jgi:hypothetical protein